MWKRVRSIDRPVNRRSLSVRSRAADRHAGYLPADRLKTLASKLSSWKPADMISGPGFTYRSGISSRSAILARTGCSQPPRRRGTVVDLCLSRGKVLGGSSATISMIYMRRQAAEYDGWRRQGRPNHPGGHNGREAGDAPPRGAIAFLRFAAILF